MSLAAGQQAKLRGLNQLETNQSLFLASMRKTAISLSKSKGRVTSDDLRRLAATFGLAPDHPNAWGGIFRGKHWKEIGREKSSYTSNHAREIRVWRWEGA